MQAVAVPTPSWQVAEGQGPVLGIPLVSSQGFKAGQVGLSWLGSCAQCSSLSTGQQDIACSSVCSDALLGPHSPSSGPCERKWPGKGEKVSASLPETPVEQHKLLCEPKELWNMSWPSPMDHEGPSKCFPPPQLSTFPILKSTRIMAG